MPEARHGNMPSTSLSPNDKLRVIYAHVLLGVPQHTLAAMYGINAGRVAEAVSEWRAFAAGETDA